MKVAEISAFCQFSVGKIMKDIKSYIEKYTDDSCEIFFARGDENPDPHITKFGVKSEIKANALVARLFDNDGFGFSISTNKLIKHLKEFKPDIIHIHCLHGYHCNVKRLFSFLLNETDATIVWTMHDTWAFTGHCCFFGTSKCQKWKDICHHCPSKKDYPKSILFDRSKSNYKKKKKLFTSLEQKRLEIVAPSKWLSDIVKESYLGKYNVTTINNGVNTDVFNLTPSYFSKDLCDKKIILGVASVWDSRKGIKTFIDLSKYVSDEYQIIIIGKIQENVKLPNNIIHIQRTTNEDELKFYYQHALVLVNPTRDDNYPTVNLEAQLCGCKVICFNSGGSKETNIGNLEIVDEIDGKQLFDIIKRLEYNSITAIDQDRASDITMGKNYYQLFLKVSKQDGKKQ